MIKFKLMEVSAPCNEIATSPLEILVHDDPFRKGIRNDVLNEMFGKNDEHLFKPSLEARRHINFGW